ncbi:MAG: hypothetical protein ACTSXK_02585, partial [Promethearchaeota archaeon]
GIDPTTSHAILSEITENFSIYLDEILTKNPDLLKGMKKGIIPNFSGFSHKLEKILESLDTEESFSMDINLNIPNKALKIIDELFKDDISLAKTYDFDGIRLLNQILSEYSESGLEKDIKKRFIEKIEPLEKDKGKRSKNETLKKIKK